MSDHPSHREPGASRKFIPEVKPLEYRLLLSQRVSFPDGGRLVVPTFLHLPRTGGISVHTGAVLEIGVGQPTTNSVQVTDDAKGDVQAEWNGGSVQALTGITSTVIESRRATTDQFTFHLSHGDTVTAAAAAAGSTFHQPSPSTGSTGIELGRHGPTDSLSANTGGHPLRLIGRRTSGTAVQSGSVLTVTVNKSTTNTVAMSDHGGGAVQVEWNGGAVHSFTGVATIVVDTQNARKDLVALNDVAH
jgi:hypothetical protein